MCVGEGQNMRMRKIISSRLIPFLNNNYAKVMDL